MEHWDVRLPSHSPFPFTVALTCASFKDIPSDFVVLTPAPLDRGIAMYTRKSCYYIVLFWRSYGVAYADNPSPPEPTWLSLAQGELIDIISQTGVWWRARKADGLIGCESISSPLFPIHILNSYSRAVELHMGRSGCHGDLSELHAARDCAVRG